MPETQKTMPDPAWADLWPAPRPGRPWSELRQAAREGRLVADWHARWPGTAFPLSPAACPVCRPLRAWHDALDAARYAAEADPSGRTPGPTAEAIEIGFAVEEALRDHRDLHVLVARELADVWADATDATLTARVERARAALDDPGAGALLLAEAAVRPFADPAWDEADGRPVLREPAGSGGITERSKAFFLLHRHRFGAFVAATTGDYEEVQRRSEGAASASLRLYDDVGRVLELVGTTAGYGGEGPRGTVWVLRAAGLPEGIHWPSGETDLEHTVFGQRAFRWPPDPDERAW